jgi:tetratricopeptide (TPR) repeat protein
VVRNRDRSGAGGAAREDGPSHQDAGSSGRDPNGGTPTGADVSSSFVVEVVEEGSAVVADRGHAEGRDAAAADHDADSDAPGADDDDDDRTAAAGSARRRVVQALVPGSLLANRYQIEAPLGEGGSGTVYRAWDRMLSELIAIKVLHPERARERSWIKRLAREVRVARAIRHPNVCRVFELGHAEGFWFVTMELARGGSLRDRLGPTGAAAARNPPGDPPPPPMPLRPLAARLDDIRQLCAGLGAMHGVGITHRDVTPRNVLVMDDGRLTLTDFGLAIERDDQTTVLGGTPAYMPPEAARGARSDQRSDVFQLGMIMHEILTGKRPTWTADGTHLDLGEPEASASATEFELERLVAECVDRDPARRPPTALAVAGRLAAAEAAREQVWLLRMLARWQRLLRRHPRLLRVMAGVMALAAVARVVQVVSRPPLCQGGAGQIAGVWDGARAEAVRRAFAATRKPYADDAFSRVKTILDQFSSSWVRMYGDACEATHLRGEQSTAVLDLRMGCLKARSGDLRALVDLFSSVDGEVVARSINAASALPPVALCADVEALQAVVPPPSSAQARGRVEALRQRLSEARALHAAGLFNEGTKAVKALVEDTRALGYEPLLAEVLQVAGEIEMWTRSTDEAAALFDEALLRAEESRHDRVLAEVAVYEVSFFSVFDRLDALDRSVPRARATLARIGGDARLESWLDTAIAYGLKRRKRYAEGLAMDEQALALKRRALGNDHWDVALTLGNIADELHLLGRNEEALIRNATTLEVLERALGPRHPDVALHLFNRGEIHLALGQPQQALDDYHRALEIWKDALTPEHLYVSFALTGIGLAHLRQAGDVGEAVAPLERALAIRNAASASPGLRAETSFALARALWLTGRDHVRAVDLAEEARGLLPADRVDERAEIAGTLAGWRAPSTLPPRRPRPVSAP